MVVAVVVEVVVVVEEEEEEVEDVDDFFLLLLRRAIIRDGVEWLTKNVVGIIEINRGFINNEIFRNITYFTSQNYPKTKIISNR